MEGKKGKRLAKRKAKEDAKAVDEEKPQPVRKPKKAVCEDEEKPQAVKKTNKAVCEDEEEPQPVKKKHKKAASEGDEEEEKQADDEEEEEDLEGAEEEFAVHQEGTKKNSEAAGKNFLKETGLFKWASSSSGKQFIIRAKKWKDRHEGFSDLDEKGFDWPRSWVGKESKPVMAAVWLVDGSAIHLVGMWTFSPGGDETGFEYLESSEEDMHTLLEQGDNGEGPIPDDDPCSESLSISSGDDVVKRFYCPALEDLIKIE